MRHLLFLSLCMPVFFLLFVAGALVSCTQNDSGKSSGINVTFPEITGPTQITKGDKEHFFASYYGINSFSQNQQYATVLQTDVKFGIPTENDTATLGLVDLITMDFIPIAETRAWNFQQGCMAHWLGKNPDSLIIFNDLRE